MATITLRLGKGSPLTNSEVDDNFTNLNTELGTKANSSALASYLTTATAASTYLPLSGGTLTGASTVSVSTWSKWILETTGITAKARQGSDGNGLNFTTNAQWTGSAWAEDDTTKKKFAYIQHLGNGRHEFRTAPTGVGISFVTSLTVDESSVNSTVALTQSGSQVLHAANYNSYSPTLTGTGASGTWGISITGNAATVTSVTSGQVTTALGFTPYNATNPSGYTTNTGTVTSVGGTGTVSGLTLTGTVTGSGSLTLGGSITGFLPTSGGTLTGALTIGASGNTRGVYNTNGDFLSFYSTEAGARIQLGRDVGASGGAGLALGGSSYALIGTSDTNGSNLYVKLSTAVGAVSTSPSFSFLSSGFYVGANLALHAGNYNSYALPIGGGTLTGTLAISNGDNSYVTFGPNTTYSGSLRVGTGIGPLGLVSGRATIYSDNGNLKVDAGTGQTLYLNQHNGGGTVYIGGTTNYILHTGNYNSFAPTLTGTGASGTWGISISGNSATATNGLVSTGSYANPSWITSLDASKLTGTLDNARVNGGTYTINITGNAGTATTATNQSGGTVSATTGAFSGVVTGNVGGGYARFNAIDQYHSLILRGTVAGSTTQTITATDVMEFIEYGGVWNFRQVNALGTNTIWATVNTSGISWNGNTVLHAGNYNSYSPTLTGTGASGTWGISISGNAATATLATSAVTLTSTQSNWNSTGVISNVVGMLGWKNYGNSHVIFDASASLSPSGGAVNNTNSQVVWTATYPTLMGWNGTNTYGVRVDSARVADSAGAVDYNALTNKGGGTGSYITSGDYRAPSFYDSNNTAYYVDPASTSKLSTLEVGTGPGGNNAANLYMMGNNTWRWIAGYSPDYGVGNGFGLYADSLGYYAMSLSTSGNWWFGVNNHSSSYRVSIDGTGYANGDFRAPIFYDSNDTGYYVDPASTSVLNAVNWYSIQNWAGDGTYARGTPTYGYRFNNSADTINAFLINNSGDTTSYSSSRAPIFYDSNNTNYYVDPASTSVLNAINLNTAGTALIRYLPPGTGTVSINAPFYWNGVTGAINIAMTDNDTGGIVIDNEGVTVYGAGDTGGVFRVIDEDVWQSNGQNVAAATGLYVNQGVNGGWGRGNWEFYSSARAPIFYDLDDTGYYTDPNSTSRTADIYTNRIGVGQGVNASWPLIVSGNAYLNANGYGQAEGSWRAPLFYDSSDTAYYTDPAGASQLNFLYTSNNIRGGGGVTAGNASISSGYGGFAGTPSNGYLITTNINYNVFNMPTIIVEGYAYGNAQTIHIEIVWYSYNNGFVSQSYTNLGAWDPGTVRIGTNGSDKICIHFSNNIYYGRMNVRAIYDQSPDYLLNWSVQQDVSYSGLSRVTGVGTQPIRAGVNTVDSCYVPILYDVNNTAYYVDPTSTTALRTVGSWRADSAAWDGEFSGKIQYHSSNWYLQYAGSMLFRNSGGSNVFTVDQSGNAVASGNVTAYSDARLKENVVTIDAALDKVLRLRGVYYNKIGNPERRVGVIAQETEPVLPEVVRSVSDTNPSTGETTELLAVDYGNITGLLIEATKEQNQEVVDLRNRVAQLESLINKLIGD